MKKSLGFRFEDEWYVLTNGPEHRFEHVRYVNVDDVLLFDSDKHAMSYANAMIDRGLWNDVGIYMHTWTLLSQSSVICQRIISTEKFINEIKKNALSSRYKMFTRTIECTDVVTADDVGFLNIDNYQVFNVELLLRCC